MKLTITNDRFDLARTVKFNPSKLNVHDPIFSGTIANENHTYEIAFGCFAIPFVNHNVEVQYGDVLMVQFESKEYAQGVEVETEVLHEWELTEPMAKQFTNEELKSQILDQAKQYFLFFLEGSAAI